MRIPKNRAPAHPGDILDRLFLQPLQLTQVDFAAKLGYSTNRTVNELVNRRRDVTPETALILSKALGTTPDFWLNLQVRYNLWLKQQDKRTAQRLKRVRIVHRGPATPTHTTLAR
jgi:addiction module HigA family antidote